MPVHMDLSGAYNAIQFFDGLADSMYMFGEKHIAA